MSTGNKDELVVSNQLEKNPTQNLMNEKEHGSRIWTIRFHNGLKTQRYKSVVNVNDKLSCC